MANIKEKLYRTLRSTEKYTKTDMIYMAKGGSWLLSGQIISSIIIFLSAIAFANLIPKEVYGTYKYVLSIAGLLTAFTLTGLGTSISKAASEGFESIIKKSFLINIKGSFIFILTTIILSGYYFFNNNSELGYAMLIIGFFSPLVSGFNLFSPFLVGKKDFRKATLYWTSKNILSTSSLILILFFSQNIFVILVTYFFSQVIFSGFFFALTVRQSQSKEGEDFGVVKYAKHLSVMNIISTGAVHLDKILVFHYLGGVELAIYTFATAVPEQMRALFKQISLLAFPKFVTKKITDIKFSISKKIFGFFSLVLVTTIFYIIISPYLFQLIFPEYIDSVIYSQIFSISLIGVIGLIPLSALKAKAESKTLYKINTINALLGILTMFIGIYFYGLLGLVVARVFSKTIETVVIFFFLHQTKEVD